ncbi:NAD-dependent epimerase/dehydratase family protein [Salipiger sp. 1_MG-2023]|uniref:NAD-dependent epimerase/dehydratase family protein n=1 Tax=Salipiger sp. 1_MG-2023 TaxID=3062665 RepID=UPI0026E3FCF5|nr:NAD-dependent epimerase/dehydratase family protein [Salipiger sp. 1_MG-2023]MDO6586301.1 NAD-dependent epimerase/dehydratase family protein [Salipiger sp. 1_MG-2023]
MGEITRILITGAGGFIGRATVAEARARGLGVVAVVRRSGPDFGEGVEVVQADLSDPACIPALSGALRGCSAVIHAAAHLGDNAEAVALDTLKATSHLLHALPGGLRLVLVSSIAVYDTGRLSPGDTVSETTPLFTEGTAPDAYAGSKLAQEALCRARKGPLWLMRPGAVWGPGRTWHALNGISAGPLHLALTSDGELPLAHVTSVARALVSAAQSDPQGIRALNVIDDDRPTRWRFARAHQSVAGWPRAVLPLPWGAWLALARALTPLAPNLPGLLRVPILRARIMPLRWPNTALRETLGGGDTAPLKTMLDTSMKAAP